MRNTIRVFSVVLLLASLAGAQAAKPATTKSMSTKSGSTKAASSKPAGAKPSIPGILNNALRGAESEFVDAADAMPEDKYNFAPSEGEFKGVRTFAQQVKHVAATNYLIGAAILGEEKPPVDIGQGESGPDSITAKADIMKFLKASFEYQHKAMATLTSEAKFNEQIKSPFGPGQTTRGGMAVLEVGHCFDHYGQMVEYLRMNAIIPPASRPRPAQ